MLHQFFVVTYIEQIFGVFEMHLVSDSDGFHFVSVESCEKSFESLSNSIVVFFFLKELYLATPVR